MADKLLDHQRQVANAVMISMCHGNYEECLHRLRTGGPLPPTPESNLEAIVLRLMNPKEGKKMAENKVRLLGENKALVEHLRICHGDATIPDQELLRMYESAMNLGFECFHKSLEEPKFVEHKYLQTGVVMAQACNKLIFLQQRLDRQHRELACADEKLVLIVGLMFLIICGFDFYLGHF